MLLLFSNTGQGAGEEGGGRRMEKSRERTVRNASLYFCISKSVDWAGEYRDSARESLYVLGQSFKGVCRVVEI